VKHIGKNFAIVDQPGPGVAKLSAALTDATSAVPVLRTISLVSPQARVKRNNFSRLHAADDENYEWVVELVTRIQN
jgi:hypothetical protein